jgi:hypothetical protein
MVLILRYCIDKDTQVDAMQSKLITPKLDLYMENSSLIVASVLNTPLNIPYGTLTEHDWHEIQRVVHAKYRSSWIPSELLKVLNSYVDTLPKSKIKNHLTENKLPFKGREKQISILLQKIVEITQADKMRHKILNLIGLWLLTR